MTFGFALWFALVDLFGRARSRQLSGMQIANLTALIGLALALIGLILDSDRRQMREYDGDPVSTSLVMRWKEDPAKAITDDDIASLKAALKDVRIRDVLPFRGFLREIYPVGTLRGAPPRQGRTFRRNDPLLTSFAKKEHWLWRADPVPEKGIVLTRQLLADNNIPLDPPPSEVDTLVETQTERVKVIGVLAGQLPGKFQFALSEEVADELDQRSATPPVKKIRTGLLPPMWAAKAKPPDAIAQALANPKHKIKIVSRVLQDVDEYVWALECLKDSPPRLREWRDLLEEIAQDAGLKDKNLTDFLKLRADQPLGPVARPNNPPTLVGIYVRLPGDMDGALKAAERLGYVSLDDRHKQIQRIYQATLGYLTLAWLGLAAFTVLTFANCLALHSLAARQKRAELGMLKAMGVSNAMLALIGVIEAVYLWLPSAVLGLLVGVVAGFVGELVLGGGTMDYVLPWGAAGIAIVGALVLSIGSTVWANRAGWRSTPQECLGES